MCVGRCEGAGEPRLFAQRPAGPGSPASVADRAAGRAGGATLPPASRFMRSTRGSPAICGMSSRREQGRPEGLLVVRRGGSTGMRCAGCSRIRRIERLRERTKTTDRLLRDQGVPADSERAADAGGGEQAEAPAAALVLGDLWEGPDAGGGEEGGGRSCCSARGDPDHAERMFALFREEALTVVPGATEAAVETIRTALALLQVLRGGRAGGGADDAVAGRFVGGRGWGRPRRDGTGSGDHPALLGDKPLARLAGVAVCGGDYR